MYGCIKNVEATYEKFVPSKNRFESICEITLENHKYHIYKSLYITKYGYHFHSMLTVNNSNQQCRKESVIITFWGHLARTFDAEYVDNLPPLVLAVFTSLKMATFRGTCC